MKRNYIFLILFILISPAVFSAGSQEGSDSFKLITTTSIIDDVVRQIVGESAEIHNLMTKGSDPHSYEPTPRDMAKVERADIVFTNGLGLEESLIAVLETVHKGEIVEVSQTIALMGTPEHEEDQSAHEHEGSDPHSWMSPLNVLRWVDVIEAALAEADPLNSSVYKSNADVYRTELNNLDRWMRTELEVLPVSKRILVTDHNVFSYFARDYHFDVIGTIIPGFSSSAEPSAGDISRLISILEKEQVQAVFIGESAGEGTRKLAETLGEESAHPISVHQVLTGSLREDGEEGDSYISFMKYNVLEIISGLSE
jgi:ABC-type Zn uptake system ZnuABC Zn-binding protein ZnuA